MEGMEAMLVEKGGPESDMLAEDLKEMEADAEQGDTILSRVQDCMVALMEAQRVCQLEAQAHWKTIEDRRIALEAAVFELQQSSDCKSEGEVKTEENGKVLSDGAVNVALVDNSQAGPSQSIPEASPPAAAAADEKHHDHHAEHEIGAHDHHHDLDHHGSPDTLDPHKSVVDTRPRWQQILQSPKFDLWVGVIIILNCVVMSLQLEYNGQLIDPTCGGAKGGICQDAKWQFAETSFAVIEQVFTALFAIELAARLVASGLGYLCSLMNAVDAMIVFVSSVDSWVLTPLGNEQIPSVTILRLVRLVRLSKVLRVVRVMKAFKSLRVLVSAVANSVGALGWSMTLLFVLELSGAIFLAQLLRPYIEDTGLEFATREFIWLRFGTWVRAMLSVFEITMAPGGFIKYRVIADKIHHGFGVFFVLYVCIVTFAVVRVITALFLKATLSASDQDEARLNADRARKQEAYLSTLRRTIAAARGVHHSDPGLRLDKEDLKQMEEVPEMREWLQDIELPPADADRLFSALDPGDGMVVFNDYTKALIRMRGPPRGSDAIVVRAETHRILRELSIIKEEVGKRFALASPETDGCTNCAI